MVISNEIGSGYDTIQRAYPGIVELLHNAVGTSGPILDLACGSSQYAADSSVDSHAVTGNSDPVKMKTEFDRLLGDCTSLPYRDGSWSAVTCRQAIQPVQDEQAAFREAFRVLVPGGRLAVFLCWPEQLEEYWLAEYFPRLIANIAARTPSREAVLGALQSAGFTNVSAKPWYVPLGLQETFLYSAKHSPERYLDPSFRAEILTFCQLTNPSEVDQGIAKLADDLRTGRFHDVRNRFAGDTGDYALVTASKAAHH